MQMLGSDVPDTREDTRRASSDQTPETRGPASLLHSCGDPEALRRSGGAWTTQAQPHFHSTPCVLKHASNCIQPQTLYLHSVTVAELPAACTCSSSGPETRSSSLVDVRGLSDSRDDPKSSSRASSGQRNPWSSLSLEYE